MSADQAEANRFYTQNLFGNEQENKVLTSFGHWVKNPEGGDGTAF